MNGLGAGATLLVAMMAIGAGVFVSVLSIVALVKVVQIAEDLRYIRSKTDIKVQRPKPWTTTLLVCLGVSVGIIFLAMVCIAGNAAMFTGIQK